MSDTSAQPTPAQQSFINEANTYNKTAPGSIGHAIGTAFSSINQAINPFSSAGGSGGDAQQQAAGKQIGAGLAGEASGGQGIIPPSQKSTTALSQSLPKSATPPPTKSTTTNPDTTSTSNNNLQALLSQGVKPYLSQLQSGLQQTQDTNLVKSWMPKAIQGPIANFEKLANKNLPGLYKAYANQAQNSVASAATSQLLNIIPTALAYNAIEGNLPYFNKQPGLQSLWQLLENVNLKLPNPTETTPTSLTQQLQSYFGNGNSAGTSASDSTTGS